MKAFFIIFNLFVIWSVVLLNPVISNSPRISSYILAFLTAFSILSCISVDDQIAIKVFISSVDHCWMYFSFVFSSFSLIILVDGWKKMAVAGGVAPPITSVKLVVPDFGPSNFRELCRCCTQFSTPGVRCTPSRERAPLAWSERKAVRLNKRRGKYYTTI